MINVHGMPVGLVMLQDISWLL